MKKLYIQAGTNSGCVFYTEIAVSEDYTMNEVVRTVRNKGYDYFRICETMNVFVNV